MTEEQLKEKIKILKAQLTVNKKNLSSWKRKLNSAPDARISAKGIGIFAIVILITLGVAIVILDIPNFVAEHQRLMKMFQKCRHAHRRTESEA